MPWEPHLCCPFPAQSELNILATAMLASSALALVSGTSVKEPPVTIGKQVWHPEHGSQDRKKPFRCLHSYLSPWTFTPRIKGCSLPGGMGEGDAKPQACSIYLKADTKLRNAPALLSLGLQVSDQLTDGAIQGSHGPSLRSLVHYQAIYTKPREGRGADGGNGTKEKGKWSNHIFFLTPSSLPQVKKICDSWLSTITLPSFPSETYVSMIHRPTPSPWQRGTKSVRKKNRTLE